MSYLTSEQVQNFQRDGYVRAPAMMREKLERLRSTVERHLQPPLAPLEFEADVSYPGSPESQLAVGGQTPRRLLSAYSRDPIFREIAADER
ncbi:MAG: hypothetical protein ACPGSC_06705, partial [Granulosicoccaceae bacterium]